MMGFHITASVSASGQVNFKGADGGLIMLCMQRIQHFCPNMQQAIIAVFPNIVSPSTFAMIVRNHVLIHRSRVSMLARVLRLYRTDTTDEFTMLWNYCREPGCLDEPSTLLPAVDLLDEARTLRSENLGASYHSHWYLLALFVRATQDTENGFHHDLVDALCAAFPNIVTPVNFSQGLRLRVLPVQSRMNTLRTALFQVLVEISNIVAPLLLPISSSSCCNK